jgi:outer membrane protein OmpA-like peptidoglycan-associated protein
MAMAHKAMAVDRASRCCDIATSSVLTHAGGRWTSRQRFSFACALARQFRSMMRVRALLPWLCAAIVACATAPKPPPSEEVAAGDGGAAKNESMLEIFGDTDRDGIDDARDRCPGDAEDRDQFQDDDGCPELDNDHDRILDAEDECPNEPETYNARDDDDGCPDLPVLRARPLYQIEPLLFARGRATLDEVWSPLLHSLAVAIKDEVDCHVVELTGHTSDDERRLEGLAAARAERLRSALIERGVPPEQLQVRSVGTVQPVCREATEPCRTRNRRVELFVLDLRICK